MKPVFRAALSALVAPALFAVSVVPALAQDAPAPSAPVPSAPPQTVELQSEKRPGPDEGQGVLFPFSLLDMALDKRVDKSGNVDYANLKGDENLQRFLQAVANADLSRFPTYPIIKEETDQKPKTANSKNKVEAPQVDRTWELAFWINAYNAHVLNTVSQAYPISSVDEIKEFDAPGKFAVAKSKMSLADMRAKIAALDRRALFLLTDGTLGGPKPAPRSYRWTGLNEAMEIGVGAIVNDPRFVELTRIQNRVAVNPFLAGVDEYWKPVVARRKWDGVRFVLKAYTDTKANQSYYNTGNYEILFLLPERKLNAFAPAVGGG